MSTNRWPTRSSKLRRGFRAVGLALLALLLGYITAGLGGGVIGTTAPPAQEPRPYRIGLLSGPIHYDLLLPLTPQTRAAFAFAEGAGVPVADPWGEWLIVGWGAKGFYTAPNGVRGWTLPILFRAISGDTSVLRLDVAGPVIDATGITYLDLTQTQFDSLITVSLAALASPVPLPDAGFTDTDSFFPARGNFDILRTCNTWIGTTLRDAGLPFGRWTPFPQSVRLSLWWNDLAAR